jgi:hypothetical protein
MAAGLPERAFRGTPLNVLPSWKRALVLEMHSRGATIREIGDAVGCHRSTVTTCVERIVKDRRKIVALVGALEAKAASLGLDLWDLDEYLGLLGHLNWSCPIHPEQEDLEGGFSDNAEGCLKCIASVAEKRSDGLKRHHERRKQAGDPILPPRRPKKSMPPILA